MPRLRVQQRTARGLLYVRLSLWRDLRRSPSASKGMRVLKMSEKETMQEQMKREQEQTLATLMRANRAFERIFGVQEEEGEGDE